jgi:T5SS/PEP-CTERM-associated repeat protein
VTGANGFTIGNTNGQAASLNVSSGTLNPQGSNSGATSGGIGVVAGSVGSLTINSGAAFSTNDYCDIGVSGNGTLNVYGSATLVGTPYLGTNAGSLGQVIVTGPGSSFSAPNGLIVGNSGTGSLSVNVNGSATVPFLTAGNGSNAHGTVSVGDGNGSAALTLSNGFTIGNYGTGTLNVNSGGVLTGSGTVVIGPNNGSTGTVNVAGDWEHSGGSIFVGGTSNGPGGTGGLNIYTGGLLNLTGTGNGITAYQINGTVTLSGGTLNTPNLTIPNGPVLTDGYLNIIGGTYNNSHVTQFIETAAGHSVSISLQNGAVFAPLNIFLGGAGYSSFAVQGGSTLTASAGSGIGVDGSTYAIVTVNGSGSTWNSSVSAIRVGSVFNSAGSGTLYLANGGVVNTGNQDLLIGSTGSGASGTVNVTGAMSAINTGAGKVSLGDFSGTVGTLAINTGGTVTSPNGLIGRVSGASGTATVGGTGGGVGTWNIANILAVGGDVYSSGGAGILNVASAGVVNAGVLTLWPNGTVNLTGGTLAVGYINFNGGAINFNGGTLRYTATTSFSQTYNLNFCSLEAASGVYLSLSGAAINGGFLRGAGTFLVSGGTTFGGTSTAASTNINVYGAATFQNFSNSGTFLITSGPTNPVTVDSFINQGSGAVTVGAGGQINASDFQTYGTLTLNPGSASASTQMINNGATPLYFNGGSRTFISIPSHAGLFDAGIDLHGNNAVVAGGLLVNNGYVVDSGPTGKAIIVADFGSLVKGAGFYQNSVQTVNGGKFQSGNSPGKASFGSFSFGPGGVSNYLFAIDDAAGVAGPSPDVNGHVSGWGLVNAVQRPVGPATTPGDFAWTAEPSQQLTVALDTLLNPTTVGADVAGPMDHFDPSLPYSWLAVGWAGAYHGPPDAAALDASTAFDTGGFLNPIAGPFGWSLDAANRTLSLTYTPTAVPEPGTLGPALAAAVWLASRRRGPNRRYARSNHEPA